MGGRGSWWWGFGFIATILGCGTPSKPAATQGKPAPAPTPSVVEVESPPAPSPEDVAEAKTLVERAAAAKVRLRELLNYEDKETQAVAGRLLACPSIGCIQGLAAFNEEQPLAYALGAGLWLIRAFDGRLSVEETLRLKHTVESAETSVIRAEKLIKERTERAEAEVTNARLEEAAIWGAERECKTIAACEAKCKGGEWEYCYVAGQRLEEKGKLAEAVSRFKTACDLRYGVACQKADSVGQTIEKQEAEKAAERARLEAAIQPDWDEVESAVDELVSKQYQLKFASKHLRGRRKARTLQMMREHVAAYRTEVYCPAATTFIKAHGKPEFRDRAKEHCEERPPSMTGISGAEVELKAECRAAYAITCR